MKFYSDMKITHWNYVERVASNDLSRIVGLVPLIGYLILFNDEIADIASFRTIAGVVDDNTSPFILSGLTKMRLVFFGSLFILISNLIFIAFRPNILQRSKGDMEFCIRVRDSYSVHELSSMEKHIFSCHWKPRTKLFWKVYDETRAKRKVISGFRPDARAQMFLQHGDYIHFLAREWWAGMMHTYRIARFASVSFGITGYILLAIPTLDISQAVLLDIYASFMAGFA